jgi:hypothetical protein
MVLIEAMNDAQVGGFSGSSSAFLIFFVGRGCFLHFSARREQSAEHTEW